MARERQLELFAARALTASERRELIRQRLEGFEYRQRAREAKRLRDAAPAAEPPRQATIDEFIARGQPGRSDG